MNKNQSFEFQGEPTANVAIGMFTLATITVMAVSFIFLANLYSIITGLVLLSVVVVILSKAVRKVVFHKDRISVRYFLGTTKVVLYADCKKLYKTNDGLAPAPINVVKYRKNGRLRKFTFVAEDKELDELCDAYFNGFRAKSHHK